MGIFAKIKKAWFDTIVWETIDDEFYDELEDSLIMADLGATVAHDAVKKLRDVVYQKSIQRGDDVKQALRDILIEKLNVGDTALDLSTKPSVVLVIGVNGVGKTTSIGKIAHRLRARASAYCCARRTRSARRRRISLKFGQTAPSARSSARSRARIPARCCSTRSPRRRREVSTSSSATRRADFTTR